MGELDLSVAEMEREINEAVTVIDGAVIFVRGVSEKLKEYGAANPKILAYAATLDAKANELAAALVENTPTPE